jgi:hypothetical protein
MEYIIQLRSAEGSVQLAGIRDFLSLTGEYFYGSKKA